MTASLLLGLFFVLLALPAGAAPTHDAGDFPTLTPTFIPFPTETPTLTPVIIVVTLDSGYPAPTIETFDPGAPSNIQEEDLQATRMAQQAAEEPEPRGNPLITAAYIGLFILLVVGVWMLFSRRGYGP
ncbi:MAG TPA: hypothetical protein VMN57_13185 [Anaerolineales bacterium]|nr:hypothetical protein [Anaerolineales bacterium]